jgi:hypothetical protein
MKFFLFLLVPAMFLIGCAGEIELTEPSDGGEKITQIPPRNLNEAVFHEGAQAWMIPQKDPYTLDNFQNSCNNLISGVSTQILTRAQTAELSAAPKLKATHYALRIYSKNEDEQWEIELMKDVVFPRIVSLYGDLYRFINF